MSRVGGGINGDRERLGISCIELNIGLNIGSFIIGLIELSPEMHQKGVLMKTIILDWFDCICSGLFGDIGRPQEA